MSEARAIDIWINFLKKRWGIYLLGIFTVLITNLMQVIWTRVMGWVVDFFGKKPLPVWLQKGTDLETFFFLFWLILITRILLTLGRMGWRYTLARQTHYSSGVLKERIWDVVRYFPKTALDKVYTKGMLMSASVSDVGTARIIFGFTLVMIVDFFFLSIFASITMAMINLPMTLMSLGILIFIPIAVKKLSAVEIVRYSAAQDALSLFNDLTAQVISTVRLQRLTQTGPFWEKRMLRSAERYRKRRLKAVYTSLNYIPLMGGASLISYLVLFALGIHFVLNGSMTLGDFVAMQGFIFLIQDPLMELGFIISDWQKGMTSLERLREIYCAPKDYSLLIEGEKSLAETPAVLEAKNLSYTYEGGSISVLKDITLDLKQGERLGISGPIGSGKSTLITIMAGLKRDHGGSVVFHGRPFDAYSHANLRNYIGMVPQKTFLLAESIRHNILMDRKVSDEEIWHYIDMAGFADDVKKFPNKLDTALGEWGINLSGGQKQRLTLARALVRRPKLLFLDDCLSAVDTVTEEKILKNLDRELKDTTLVWVAHRKSTLKYCHHHLELKTALSPEQNT